MAEIIEVNTRALAADTDDVENTVKAIRADMAQMFQEIMELKTMWDGKANAAFTTQFINDKESMEELCKNMDSLVDSMRFAKTEYDKCEDQVHSTVAAIKI